MVGRVLQPRIASRALASLAAAALFLITCLCGADAQQAATLTISQVDASSYPDITAVVTALDGSGLPQSGLAPAQFRATDGEQPVAVMRVDTTENESLPLSVVLVLDVSGSMSGGALDGAKRAAADFIASLRPNDQAGLVTFNDSVAIRVGLTGDRGALTGAIGGLQASGGTALYEAVQTGVYMARVAPSERKAVVVLTDGENTAQSQTTADGSLAVGRQGHLPIFTVGFGAAPDEGYLRTLASATQGQYRAATAGNVGAVYADIAALLRNQYILTMNAPAAADGKEATLRVTASIGGSDVSGTAKFVRGSAPDAVASPPPAEQPAAAPSSDSGSGFPLVMTVAAAGGVAAVMLLGFGGARRMQYARAQRARERGAGRLSDEDLPAPSLLAVNGEESLHARLVALDGDNAGTGFEFGERPLTIGSDAACGVRLPPAADVAPEHAIVYTRGEKIMLRHIGGPRRATAVGGRQIDWVILEDGDELRIGPKRYRAERMARK